MTQRCDRQNRDGTWKAWSDAPWIVDCKPLRRAKDAAQAATLYKSMAGEVSTEQGSFRRVWDDGGMRHYKPLPDGGKDYTVYNVSRPRRRGWEVKPAVILRGKAGHIKLIVDESLEREKLEGDTLQALGFWQIVAKDLATPLAVVKIT